MGGDEVEEDALSRGEEERWNRGGANWLCSTAWEVRSVSMGMMSRATEGKEKQGGWRGRTNVSTRLRSSI